MGRRSVAAALITAAASCAFMLAQETVFRSDVQLVRVLATVKDRSGAVVAGLTKADFTVTDNGAPQEITLFETYTETPLSVAILLDTSGSMGKEFAKQAESVNRFAAKLFSGGNPEDRAALFSFNYRVSQEVGFTRRPQQIRQALKTIKSEAGTSMYDAVVLAADEIQSRQGRHVMIVVTDGADTVSTHTLKDAIKAAHRADTVVYAILILPITNDAGRNIGGENALTLLATETGGRVFTADEGGPEFDRAFTDILRDLRTQYLIGYYPRNAPPGPDGFHRIQLKTTRTNLQVSARTGYYGAASDSGAGPRGPDRRIP